MQLKKTTTKKQTTYIAVSKGSRTWTKPKGHSTGKWDTFFIYTKDSHLRPW